ncbi:hypothetical protein VULLAG_LOCUS1312 [Vulpes lagopus]
MGSWALGLFLGQNAKDAVFCSWGSGRAEALWKDPLVCVSLSF